MANDAASLEEELIEAMTKPIHPISLEAIEHLPQGLLPSPLFSVWIEEYIRKVDSGEVEHVGFRAPTEEEAEQGYTLFIKTKEDE